MTEHEPRIEVFKSAIADEWLWTCPVCHYGANIPWEGCSNWADAMTDAESHIGLHRGVGKSLQWETVPLPTD